jgi:DNA replication and repair protein RecF
LEELREGEIALGSTLIGPHRDDLELLLNKNPARAYGSQGQQRTLALAMKLAERKYLQEKLNRLPLCLLDDMLSELDPDRRENLISALADGGQVLVTLTHLSEWPQSLGIGQVFEVKEGAVREEQLESHGKPSIFK